MQVVAREQGLCGEIALRRGTGPTGRLAYEVIVNGVFLMASYNQRSERALASLALAPLVGRHGLCVLIGGLGMGFTLQAALAYAGVARADVVEIEPAMEEWNHKYFAELNDHALDDQRAHLVHGDIIDYIYRGDRKYHAICLDVDNGPDWTVADRNRQLYEAPQLIQMAEILHPTGVLTVWSARPCVAFERRLRQAFGQTDVIPVGGEDFCDEPGVSWIYRARPHGAAA